MHMKQAPPLEQARERQTDKCRSENKGPAHKTVSAVGRKIMKCRKNSPVRVYYRCNPTAVVQIGSYNYHTVKNIRRNSACVFMIHVVFFQ